jgi:hypothetical protein
LKPRNKQKRNPRVPNIEQLSTCLQPLVSANKLILKQNTSWEIQETRHMDLTLLE